MKSVSHGRAAEPHGASSCRASPPAAPCTTRAFMQQTADWSDKLGMLRGTNLAALD